MEITRTGLATTLSERLLETRAHDRHVTCVGRRTGLSKVRALLDASKPRQVNEVRKTQRGEIRAAIVVSPVSSMTQQKWTSSANFRKFQNKSSPPKRLVVCFTMKGQHRALPVMALVPAARVRLDLAQTRKLSN